LDIQREVPVWHTVPLQITDVHRRGKRKPQTIDSGLAPSHLQLVYGNVPYNTTDPSTSSTLGGACSSLNPHAGPYLSAMTSQGHPIGTLIFQPSVGTSSSSSSGTYPDWDSAEDYPDIGAVSARTLPSRLATSAWCIPPGRLLMTALASTQPSGDMKRPMPRHLAIDSFEI
jgi:hypothetical protein